MESRELHIGLIGAGGFARFALNAFSKLPGIRIIAVMDINKQAARQLGDEFGLQIYDELEDLLKSENTDLIYIATPPYLHYVQAKKSLMAGKHVICEKPAALRSKEAEELVAIARSRDLLYVVNLMQRYNPLYGTVKTIIQENLLGNFRHGYFENYASDQNLLPGHWFWDQSKSGGIFIEHGVHFFDLFTGWLGEARVVGAWQLMRLNIKDQIVDRVQATLLYQGGLVNFYHGFDQPDLLDRQELRLLFEHGEITLYGWVPVKIKLHGILRAGQMQKLKTLLPEASLVHHKDSGSAPQKLKAGFTASDYENHITLEYENMAGKQHLYADMLKDMISDQWKWIMDRRHVRVIDGENAVLSTRMAEEATEFSQRADN
ncbi:MAG TPA: Gfo/Idh/MocA family oxidoreductase [Puia sp.]|nr:Gfo/Idh/MocA family oxidoreductase [Puia sp.]